MRVAKVLVFVSLLVATISVDATAHASIPVQEAPVDTTESQEAMLEGDGDGFMLFNLVGQAGGFQYPILLIFVIGLFLIFAKVYELYIDRRESSELEAADYSDMGLKRITMLVANQKQSMLAQLQATMLNVYKTSGDAATLHEEMANFIRFQRERFGTFKQRLDFLSDTAGAVGLLGTVWGMFTVFSGGVDDRQAILAGMGIALISTLLGLIASIVLNLSATEVYSFFDKRLDHIEDKADELRFRLMELNVNGEATEEEKARVSSSQSSIPGGGTARKPRENRAQSRSGESVESGRGGATTAAPTKVETEQKVQQSLSSEKKAKPHTLQVEESPSAAQVGEVVDLKLRLEDKKGNPVEDESVLLRVPGENGKVGENRKRETRIHTDDQGQISTVWQMPIETGVALIEAEVPSASYGSVETTEEVITEPGPPKKYAQSGNNQGAPVGEKLPKPISLKLKDEYENPVVGFPVTFEVDTGSGSFGEGERAKTVNTDDEGKSSVQFVVGNEPGLNVVVAKVGDEVVKFQEMGMEN